MFTAVDLQACPNGRAGGNRTPNLRFWRPPLCQLSYCPIIVRRYAPKLRGRCGLVLKVGVAATPLKVARSAWRVARSALLSNHLGNNPCTHGFAALADGKTQTLFH